MTEFEPSSLPEITSVEVIVLKGSPAPPRAGDEVAMLGREARRRMPCKVFEGKVAQRIARLRRGLPAGEQARCHIPPFGLVFRRDTQEICSASICWECNNILATVEGEAVSYEFDAGHSTSQELLKVLRELMGEE